MANLTVPVIAEPNNDNTPPQMVSTPPVVETPAPVAVPPVDEMAIQVDEAVSAVLSGESQLPKPTMQSSVAMAIGTDPDYEAELRKVAQRTGVPIGTVAAKPDEMKRKVALDNINFDSYQQLYPASALALTDIELAKIAHDDTENMGYIENTMRGIGGRAVNIGAGLARTGYTINKTIIAGVAPDLVDFADSLSDLPGTQNLKAGENFSLGYAPRTTWEDVKERPLIEFLPFALEQGLVSAPDMAAAVFAPGPYFAALTGEFAQNRAENDERKEATVGDFIAVAPAAAANALLERFATKGLIGIGDVAKGLKQIGKAIAVSALKEGTTEAVQNTAQYAAETVGTKKGFDTAQAGEQALQGFVGGAPFGAAFRGAAEGVKIVTDRNQRKIKEATAAEQTARDFEKLNELSATSKLKERDPLAFQNFIEQVAQTDGAVENVYVDPRALAQAGISLETLAEASPSIAESARVALEIGGDIKIPVSEYATLLAGTELGQSMIDHLKTAPDGMSRAEAQEFMKTHGDQLKADVEKAVADQGIENKVQQSAEVVRADIMRKLTEANRFTTDVNQSKAAVTSSFFNAVAERMGMTPEEFYKKNPLFVNSVLDSGDTLDQTTPVQLSGEGDVAKVSTGQPVTFNYVHNTESATKLLGKPKKGDQFGRDFEPSGKFLTITSKGAKLARPETMQAGELTLRNPLVVDNNNLGWKKELSKKYGGKTGKKLSLAIIADGHDGIITKDKNYISEVVDLTTFDEAKALYQSATGNEGTYNPNNPNTLKQSPEFYSALQKNIGDLKQGKGSPEQWTGIIKNLIQKGVKQEEIDWSGVIPWLAEQKGSVTKEQVNDYLKANQIKIEEVVKGAPEKLEVVPSLDGFEGEFDVIDSSGNVRYSGDQDAANQFVEEESQLSTERDSTGTKFDKYTVPGGENYRELLMTLPGRKKTLPNEPEIKQNSRGLWAWFSGDTQLSGAFQDRQQAEANRVGAERPNLTDADNYKSSHYSEPNIVAHIRFNERRDANDNRIMFVEEIQSDWHQAGRDKGYKQGLAPEEILKEKELSDKIDTTLDLRSEAHRYMREAAKTEDNAAFDRGNEAYKRLAGELDSLTRERDVLREKRNSGVPDAPFKTSWAELSFKRALMWAVENNLDSIAWTTGEQQAARYDLSKQVEQIYYKDNGDGTYAVSIIGNDGSEIESASKEDYNLADLENLVGKEIAQKIKDGVGGNAAAGDGLKFLKGENLKVGGEGMKGFYDKILPAMVNKLVKKWGGKVGTTEIKGLLTDGRTGEKVSMKLPDAVHYLEITPAMRKSVKAGLPLFQSGEQNRGSFNPATSTITLLQNADLSTFLHELGHFFLETMNKLALDPNAPDSIREDMQKVFDWLGVKDIAEWNSHDLEWQRDKHEQFARGFEAYLFEGKSPSIEMRSVFQRFRDWLKAVYRNLTALNVELTDEVRGVFDRMLATDAQIKEAEIARSFEPMFSDLRAAGMSPEEWQQYQELGVQATREAVTELETRGMRDMKFLSNAKSRALKDLQREAAGRRRDVRDQVTKEVMSEPVNQAREFITKGKFEIPDDAPQALRRAVTEMGMGSTKLSLPDLKEMYDDEANAPWRYFSTGKNGEVGTQGLHPDTVAEMFGFSSGDELVRALLAAEKPKERIAALTDQRMLEKYGDLTSPEAMSQAADEAVHNEVRSRFVATELNALQKATGGRKILAEAAKRFANGMIDRLRIRDIKPSRYAAAETRAARAAAESFKAGGLAAAAVEKRNQLIQNYAARAAYDGLAEVEKALRYFKKFDKEGSRENIATSSLDQIDALLERFDLRKAQSLKAIDKRKSLLAWVAEQEDVGIEPEIPPELLEEATRKHYKDMTLEEMRGLRDTIKQLEHIGRLKNKLLTAKDARDFKTIVDGMVASINENAGGRVVDNRERATATDRAMRLFKGFVAQHRKIASLARELDGIKDGGPVWNTLIQTMNDAGDNEASMREKATMALAKLIQPIMSEGGKMGGKGRFFETIGISLNREERIGIALNMGNAGNKQRLLDGEGWTLEQIQPVLDSLTPADARFVQSIWNFFETFRPEIGAKEKRVYGKEPAWIAPEPITIAGVPLEGGYYPIKYDTRRSIAAQQHNDADVAKQQIKGAYTSATTRRSFTKTRAEKVVGQPLLYSMDGLYNGVNEIIHDLAWHEWLIDANRLLRNKALNSSILNGYGIETFNQFKTAVKDIAGGEQPTGTSFEKAIGELRGGTVIAGLGFNIVNSIINFTGVTNSIVRIGPKWAAMGVAKFTAAPRETTKEVHQKSDFMRLRSKTMLRELNEIQSQVRGKSRVRSVMDTMMFAPLTITQMGVDVPMWYGAYQRYLTEGNSEERAVALADQSVLDAQSGGQIKDLAAIQRGGPIQKLFTTFYGYFNAAYNLGVERTKATNFKDPMSVLKLGGDYLILYTIPTVLGTLIKNALIGTEDDWDAEKLAKTLANDQISYLMGLMVGLREVTGAVQTVAGVSPYTASYGGPAGLRFFQEFYNLATQIHQGEADDALRKSIINIAGILFKLPAAQANRTIGGIEALVDGDTENPFAIVAGPPKN